MAASLGTTMDRRVTSDAVVGTATQDRLARETTSPTVSGDWPTEVSRRLMMPVELDDSLANLASSKGTTTNDLIVDLLSAIVRKGKVAR